MSQDKLNSLAKIIAKCKKKDGTIDSKKLSNFHSIPSFEDIFGEDIAQRLDVGKIWSWKKFFETNLTEFSSLMLTFEQVSEVGDVLQAYAEW